MNDKKDGVIPVRSNDGLSLNDDFEYEPECLVCGGEGFIDNPDPLWYGFDVKEIRCTSCGGSGLAKDMTYC